MNKMLKEKNYNFIKNKNVFNIYHEHEYIYIYKKHYWRIYNDSFSNYLYKPMSQQSHIHNDNVEIV